MACALARCRDEAWLKGCGATLGLGRLIDYWLNHQASGHNVPNLILKLIDPNTGTWARPGKPLPELIEEVTGYHFSFESTKGTPSNDWAWAELATEIDNNRPVHWEAFTNGGHALAAFGYRVAPTGKFVEVHTTWGVTEEAQHEEWHAQYQNGAPVTRTGVNRLRPLDAITGNGLAIVAPETSLFTAGATRESACQWIPVEIQWEVWGEQIRYADVLFSADGGNTWSPIASGLPAKPGLNSHVWLPSEATTRARLRVIGRSVAGVYVAGDGSHHDFTVLGGQVVEVRGKVSSLSLHEAAPTSQIGFAAGPGAVVVIDS